MLQVFPSNHSSDNRVPSSSFVPNKHVMGGIRQNHNKYLSVGHLERPSVAGKFIVAGGEKLYIRGVTYGPFSPDDSGNDFHHAAIVDEDFSAMTRNGINAVRTYTVPPIWLLDLASKHGLRIMVGIPWEQHVCFLDDRELIHIIERRVRSAARTCQGHPALLAYVIGNEIPSAIVRWHGRKDVERFLKHLYEIVKTEDPNGLVTYVNYPTTEYLQLPFLDFASFNVYLETQERLAAYLARLQNIAGGLPLVLAEIGLDSLRHGEVAQATSLSWQIRTVFESGCVGSFVFSWTDEWFRGGENIVDWCFGLTKRDRTPKQALFAVTETYQSVPYQGDYVWPRISVIICSYNGSATLSQCLHAVHQLTYPDYEVILVNDGSTDRTEEIALRDPLIRLINTENLGLSTARNVGLRAATGEIVAYIDDDAYPDSDWLTYMASAFRVSAHAGIGGPNIKPNDGRFLATCVDNAPGNPTHILISDQEAEHIPGCNMAFRREALEAIGGFDPRFETAGDDVDVCWRLHDRGWTLGFSPTAVVWHHRRSSIKRYWKQQWGYGVAEALLEMKWPEKYNRLGHLKWRGRVYGSGISRALTFQRWRVYHGVWGSELFQSIYEPAPNVVQSLPLMPEWYLLILFLTSLSIFGLSWSPLLIALPLAVLATAALLLQSLLNAKQSSFYQVEPKPKGRWKYYAVTAFLYLIQPLARLGGRLLAGLTPWRRHGKPYFAFPRVRNHSLWSERWQTSQEWLESIEAYLKKQNTIVRRGGEFDRWDLEVRGGLFGYLRTRMVCEEHGNGNQLIRFKSWPLFDSLIVILFAFFAAFTVLAAMGHAWLASIALSLLTGSLAVLMIGDCSAASASYLSAMKEIREFGEKHPIESQQPNYLEQLSESVVVLDSIPDLHSEHSIQVR